MKLWKVGCGVTLLGVLLTLGSCGLFGLAVDRQLDQRQIAERAITVDGEPSTVDFAIDEPSRLRLDWNAVVATTDTDREEADSTSTIVSARLPYEYRVLLDGDEVVARGAGVLTGSEIVPEAGRRDRSPMGREIDLSGSSEVFELERPGRIELVLDMAPEDEEGRPVQRASARLFDRVPTNVGGIAAGGLLSMLAGPLVAGVGLLLLLIGVIVHQQRKD